MSTITQYHALNPVFSFNPLLVSLIILIWGWGNLFILAVKTKTLKTFLVNPGFMIGDLIILPAVGFLVVYSFQQITVWEIIMRVKWFYLITIAAASLALSLFSGFRTFLKKTAPLHPLILPHFFFYWFMAFILINFFFMGFLQILFRGWSFLSSVIYATVVIGVLTHLSLPEIFGPKKFTN